MEIKFKPTVIVPKEASKIVDGTILPNDKVDIKGNIIDIATSSYTIKGCKSFYTDIGTRVMNQRPYMGNVPSYRPYKIGLNVSGVITDNQTFIIKSIKHNAK